jgi:dienelactone hydrolase
MENRQLLLNRVIKGYEKSCNLPYVDSNRVAILGFGFEGVCALDLARNGAELRGTISAYGHFDPPPNLLMQSAKTKILILHAYNDPVAPQRELRSFELEINNQRSTGKHMFMEMLCMHSPHLAQTIQHRAFFIILLLHHVHGLLFITF